MAVAPDKLPVRNARAVVVPTASAGSRRRRMDDNQLPTIADHRERVL